MRMLRELFVCSRKGHEWGAPEVGMCTASQWCERCGRHRFLSYWQTEYEVGRR